MYAYMNFSIFIFQKSCLLLEITVIGDRVLYVRTVLAFFGVMGK
jgi:hypothetical protein